MSILKRDLWMISFKDENGAKNSYDTQCTSTLSD